MPAIAAARAALPDAEHAERMSPVEPGCLPLPRLHEGRRREAAEAHEDVHDAAVREDDVIVDLVQLRVERHRGGAVGAGRRFSRLEVRRCTAQLMTRPDLGIGPLERPKAHRLVVGRLCDQPEFRDRFHRPSVVARTRHTVFSQCRQLRCDDQPLSEG